MDVIGAILTRYSVRDFSSQPVPKETVMKILEVATHSPSGINGQPWEVFVASGATLKKIRKVYQERPQSIPTRQNQTGGPPRPAFILERMVALRNERMKLLGLDPNDPSSGNVFTEWSRRLYGAPALVVICMDKGLSSFFRHWIVYSDHLSGSARLRG
jgi:nitroreductase